MITLRTFCFVCALSFSLSESPSFRESKNRELHHRQPGYYYSSFVGPQNNSRERPFGVPPELERGFRYDLDLWKRHKTPFNRNRNYYDNDLPIENRYETGRPVLLEPGTRVFRTRGKGKAFVRKRGETVYVPNELGRKRAHKGTISVRVVDRNDNEVKSSRHRGGCRECPSDQTVIAAKGNAFALLPEPCPLAPRMWNHISGPKPGSKIQEGVHLIRGSIGPKKRFCEYRYQVLVNRCEALKASDEDTTLECSAENVWGSICIFSCGEGKEAVGPTDLECREDLQWSSPPPTCKSKGDCLSPKIKPRSKISCQTANASLPESDHLPNGTTCKFKQNGKTVAITCKDGRWLKSRKSKALASKQANRTGEQTQGKNDPCNPNPCQNGGTCLKPESNKRPPICKCRPQTQGIHCELRECYYNICENEGLCIYQNEERTCYCSPEYGGDRCQNYLTRT